MLSVSEPLSIFGWMAGHDGTSTYRIVLPLMTIAAQNSDVTVSMSTHLPKIELTNEHSDVICGQRVMKPLTSSLWRDLGRAGSTLVFDTDDNLEALRLDNPAFLSPESNFPSFKVWRDEWIVAMHQSIEVADLVTTTNETLRQVLMQHSDNVLVLPNAIDAELLSSEQPMREPGERLLVGYSCSPTHDVDIRQASEGISQGLRKTDATLCLVGTDYRKFFAHKRSIFRPWELHPGAYYNNICDFHVALAPLADDVFNVSKSPLKALEAGALGIPTIADNVGPYADFIEHGVTGFVVNRPHEWAKYLRMYANDEPLRRAHGAAARLQASELTIQKNAYKWLDAYKGAMK